MRFLNELWEGIKIALNALSVHKMRAFLTILGIVVGVSTVIGIVSLIQGLNQSFTSQVSDLGSDVLYVQKFSWFSRNEWDKFRNRKNLTLEHAKAIKEHTTLVSAVAPTVSSRKTVKFENRSMEGVQIVGTNEELITSVFPEQGRLFTELDVVNRRRVCVIGWEVANVLFKQKNPVGSRIKISGHTFRVIGVLEKQGSFLGMNQDQEIRIPIGAFYKIFGSRRWLTIAVKVKDPALIEETKDEIRGILRRVRKVAPDEEDDFSINQMDMLMDMYKKLTGALYAAAIGVGSISLLVGGIGIMNIMLVSVTERTREIGIRKAIGARRRNVLWQFLIESVMISAVGGLIGVAIGFGLAQLISSVSPLPASVSLWSVFLGLGFSSAVGIFFGIYPAGKAAKLDPIEALRYE